MLISAVRQPSRIELVYKSSLKNNMMIQFVYKLCNWDTSESSVRSILLATHLVDYIHYQISLVYGITFMNNNTFNVTSDRGSHG